MTGPRCKAASLWSCSKCKKHVRKQPGMEMLDKPCGAVGCTGKLQYRGGSLVDEGSPEFKAISDYYLVGVYIRQDKTPLDRAKFHPKNRMPMK